MWSPLYLLHFLLLLSHYFLGLLHCSGMHRSSRFSFDSTTALASISTSVFGCYFVIVGAGMPCRLIVGSMLGLTASSSMNVILYVCVMTCFHLSNKINLFCTLFDRMEVYHGIARDLHAMGRGGEGRGQAKHPLRNLDFHFLSLFLACSSAISSYAGIPKFM